MRRKLNVKLLLITLGTFLVAATGVHFLHSYQVQKNSYRILDLADRAQAEKDTDRALSLYAQYLLLVPDDPDTVQKYAVAFGEKVSTVADRVRLILLMEQVLRAKPKEYELRLSLIENLIQLNRTSEAIDNLRKLQHQGYDKGRVLHMLGWCQEAKKDYAQAVRSFEEAIKVKPQQIESYVLLVTVLQDRLNQPEEAQRVIDEMVQNNPESYKAYLMRARYQKSRGEDKAAETDLDAAFKLAPDRPEVILAVSHAAREKDRWDDAARMLRDGLKRSPGQAELWIELVRLKMRTNKPQEAMALAREGLDQLPKSNDLAVLLIDLLIDDAQTAEAQKRVDDLVRAGSRSPALAYLQARLHAAHQKWGEAIPLLEQARIDLGTASEWSGRVNVLLGVCYRQIGDPEKEVEAYRRAVSTEPTWPAANAGLGGALLSRGRIDEANQVLESIRGASELPRGFWVLLSRARIARQLRLPASERRWDDIESSLARAEKDEPSNHGVAIARAEFLAARDDWAGAKQLLEKTRRDHPKEASAWIALADLAGRRGQFDEAEKVLLDALNALPARDQLDLRLALCQLWGLRGNSEDRVKLAKLAAEIPKTYRPLERARLTRSVATTWYYLGENARAEALWRELARNTPDDLRSRLLLLDAALEKQQPQIARTWLDEIHALEGDNGWVWRYGEIAIQIQEARGQRGLLDDARKKLAELQKAHKNQARLPLLAAAIYELEGRYHQAIQEYLRGLDLGDVPPRTMARLLTLLTERRDFAKAEAALGRYEQNLPLTKELARLGAEIALGLRDKRNARLAAARAERAVPLPARDYRDLLWLARIYDATQEHTLAEQRLREALDEAGHAPETWIAWLGHLALTKQRDRVDGELARMKKELPAQRYALTFARCLESLRDTGRAGKAFKEALEARPDDFITLAYAADFYRRADQVAEARKLYQRLVDPDRGAPAEYTVPARRHLAVLMAAQDPTARKSASELLDANRQARGSTLADERVRLYLQSLTSASARKDALAKFQESLRIENPSADERLLLASMLEAADLLTEARGQLADAADEAPTVENLTRYVNLLVRVDDFDEADRQIGRLEALAPPGERVRDLRTALARAKAAAPSPSPK